MVMSRKSNFAIGDYYLDYGNYLKDKCTNDPTMFAHIDFYQNEPVSKNWKNQDFVCTLYNSDWDSCGNDNGSGAGLYNLIKNGFWVKCQKHEPLEQILARIEQGNW